MPQVHQQVGVVVEAEIVRKAEPNTSSLTIRHFR